MEPGIQNDNRVHPLTWIFAIISLVATLIALHTCIRIEILNHRADGFLPRELPTEGNPKWRWSSVTNESRWKRLSGRNEFQVDDYKNWTLNEQQRQTMEREVARARSVNSLHSAVAGWGLLQYILIPIALFFILIISSNLKNKWLNKLLGISTILLAVCFGFAIYRGYFTSLGW